jgi:hypothetical protein
MTTQVEHWLLEMKGITESIIEIDLGKDSNDSLLLLLQEKQLEIRESIERYVVNERYSYSETEILLLKECLSLEREISLKVQKMYLESSDQIKHISSGKRSRDAYQNDTIQHIGYFIDRQR